MKFISILLEVGSRINEEIKAGTFRGYHRSQIDEPTKFNTGFVPGGGAGAMYGPGIYMTYELEDQLNPGMEDYGPTIVEYEVKNNGKFLIYDKSEALKVFGSNPTLIKQLKKILGGNFTNFYKENKGEIDKYNDALASGSYDSSSDIAIKLYEIPNVETYVDGIIFSGRQDSRVLAVFNTNIANPIRYTRDDGKTWVSMKDKTSHKIGRDERGDSKILNFLKIKGKGDFNKLSDEEKDEIKDYMIEKYGIKAKLVYYPEDLKPEDLDVKGDLFLANTPIKSLPDNLKVSGNLYLKYSSIESLPDNLKVWGNLDLSRSRIKSLPNNLKVRGILNLSHTPIKSLPDNLYVGVALLIGNTKIESLPNKLYIGTYLDLRDTPITSLPDDLQVGAKVLGNDDLQKQWEEIKAKRKQKELQESTSLISIYKSLQ